MPFKGRALQVQMVKSSKPQADSTEKTRVALNPEQISQIAKDHVQHVAVIAGGAYAAAKVLNTVCEIAVIASKSKFK